MIEIIIHSSNGTNIYVFEASGIVMAQKSVGPVIPAYCLLVEKLSDCPPSPDVYILRIWILA